METDIITDFAEAQAGLQDFKNPFEKDKVKRICIFCHPKREYTDNIWDASIDFQNGATKGEQEFESKNLPDLLEQMKTFVGNL